MATATEMPDQGHASLPSKAALNEMGSLARGRPMPEKGYWVATPASQAWVRPAGTSQLVRNEICVFTHSYHQAVKDRKPPPIPPPPRCPIRLEELIGGHGILS